MTIDTSAEAVAKVLDGVTDGPWHYTRGKEFGDGFEDGFDGLSLESANGEIISGCGCCGSPWVTNARDIDFIVSARQLVPAQSRDLEAMRAEREEAIKILEGVAIPLAAGFPDEGDTLVRRAKRVADGLEIHSQGTIDLIDRMSDRSKVAELERNAAIARAEQAEADADSWKTRADLSQAAIAAKNAQIIDLIEALRKRSNGELCGCGVDNPTDVCLSHYDVIEAVVRNRVQVAIAAAMMGAYKEGWSDGAANCHHDRNETPDDGWLISDTYKSIPTDATAAAIRAMKGGA